MHKLAEWLGCWAGEEVMRNLLVGVGGGLWRLFRRPTQTISEGEPMSEQKKFDPTKPVCRRDGRPARVLCADLEGSVYTIAAAVKEEDGTEMVDTYTLAGFQDLKDMTGANQNDLVNVPQRVTFWTNLYRNAENTHCWTAGGFKSEEDARSCAGYAGVTIHYVGPLKIDAEV
jgi:hypothetical protein